MSGQRLTRKVYQSDVEGGSNIGSLRTRCPGQVVMSGDLVNGVNDDIKVQG